MLKQRVITAIILAILFLAALFNLPATGWIVLVGMMVMQGAWEWSKLSKMRGFAAGAYMAVVLVSYLAILLVYFAWQPQQKFLLQILLYAGATMFWFFLVPAWFKWDWKPQHPAVLGMAGWIVLLPTGMAMLDLREIAPQPWWLLGVMAMVWVADIAAYFTGRQFGRNKLAPRISPGKTWEGVAGAILGVLAYVVLVMVANDMEQRYLLLLCAVVGVALSVMGDLFESAIKRQAGVKDSGTLLPGHGGLLDRIDALTSTLPLAAFVLLLLKAS